MQLAAAQVEEAVAQPDLLGGVGFAKLAARMRAIRMHGKRRPPGDGGTATSGDMRMEASQTDKVQGGLVRCTLKASWSDGPDDLGAIPDADGRLHPATQAPA